MELPVYSLLSGEIVGNVSLNEKVFCHDIRSDIMSNTVHWQLAKRRSGNHSTLDRGDVSGTTKKLYNQKGTGQARQGDGRGPHFVGGGICFGSHPRSYEYKLNKKIRSIAQCSSLSLMLKMSSLTVIQNADINTHKTKDLIEIIRKLPTMTRLLHTVTSSNASSAVSESSINDVKKSFKVKDQFVKSYDDNIINDTDTNHKIDNISSNNIVSEMDSIVSDINNNLKINDNIKDDNNQKVVQLKDFKSQSIVNLIDDSKAKSVLLIDTDLSERIKIASRGTAKIDVLNACGLNVRDVLTHKHIIITLNGIDALEKRFCK